MARSTQLGRIIRSADMLGEIEARLRSVGTARQHVDRDEVMEAKDCLAMAADCTL